MAKPALLRDEPTQAKGVSDLRKCFSSEVATASRVREITRIIPKRLCGLGLYRWGKWRQRLDSSSDVGQREAWENTFVGQCCLPSATAD